MADSSSLRPGGELGQSGDPTALPHPLAVPQDAVACSRREAGRKKKLGTHWSGASLDWAGQELSLQVL